MPHSSANKKMKEKKKSPNGLLWDEVTNIPKMEILLKKTSENKAINVLSSSVNGH